MLLFVISNATTKTSGHLKIKVNQTNIIQIQFRILIQTNNTRNSNLRSYYFKILFKRTEIIKYLPVRKTKRKECVFKQTNILYYNIL